MKSLKNLFILIVMVFGISSCGVPKNLISSKPDLSDYKYVYITSSCNSITPFDVIAGKFIKEGFILVSEINESQKSQTLVVNYGESGRKNYVLGYSVEVTIQLLDAQTYGKIFTSSAYGSGMTERDDLRKASMKCLAAIFS